ncbi:MAG: glucose-6-phosphate 1-dehydrogenase [Parcubacteria group bacterium Gr01-1014_8]|nr:MAG: glucose-6-phosphate 1-dehydrogenase [Parcubacteria group bacterium Gr01-1014_8]
MTPAPETNIPTILVALGGTGDLMRRKVIPAFFYLYKQGALPDKFRLVGFSRRDMTDEQFREYVKEVIVAHAGELIFPEMIDSFLKLFKFQKGEFSDKKSYRDLKKTIDECDKEWGVCSNKLFYLAVAPEFYETIFKNLSDSKLSEPCDEDGGWTRLIIEKPFGVDLKTAKSIERLLTKLFLPEQIYRIDHYLAKEMLQNILTFRFSNNLFEKHWGRDSIERIYIKSLEEIGVEKRGAFYDPVGAFRDVGQNHFLAMMALVTMEHPISFDAKAIQRKRADVLKKLKIIKKNEIPKATFRAQHEGYRTIAGVAKNSATETYFKIKAEVATKRWKGVPIILEGGKRLGAPEKEVIITFKHPKQCLCPKDGPHHKNEIIIRFEPREEILIEFWSKKPGFTMDTAPRMLHYILREPKAHIPYIEEYAKLLLDCIRGDQMLFVSTSEIQAMWRFTDPILDAWKKGLVPLHSYKPDTKEILQTSNYIQ